MAQVLEGLLGQKLLKKIQKIKELHLADRWIRVSMIAAKILISETTILKILYEKMSNVTYIKTISMYEVLLNHLLFSFIVCQFVGLGYDYFDTNGNWIGNSYSIFIFFSFLWKTCRFFLNFFRKYVF